MSATLPGAACSSSASISGSTWWPSAIASRVTRSSRSATGSGPGERWCMGGMPLHACVSSVAPASNAARAVAASAPVWPTATRTPASAKLPIASSAPGSSGAIVTCRMRPSPASSSRSTAPGVGACSAAGSCAPRWLSARKGPSRWMPSTAGSVAARAAAARTRGSSCSSGAVTSETARRVAPCAAWKASIASHAGASSSKAEPTAPWQCRSTKPGASVPVSARSGVRGGAPWPIAVMTPSRASSHASGTITPSTNARSAVSSRLESLTVSA